MIFKTIEDDLGKTKFAINDTFKSLFNGSLFKGEKLLSDDDIKALQAYNAEIERGVSPMTAYYRTMQDASDAAVNMAQSAGKGTVQINNMTKASKAAKIGMQALATVGNMFLGMAISWGVSKIVEGLDELAHSEENCKERVEELMSSYKSSLDTANSNAKRVEEIADRYEELSKGVNNLGENVSLTAEEYQEYNSIVNDIAEMFPTMVQGYTDEGNAILKLKGNVDALREAYEAEAQAAYNSLITTGKDADGNDILKDSNNIINGGSLDYSQWGNAGKVEYLDKLMNATNSVDDMLKLWNTSLNSSYREWFEEFSGTGGTDEIGKLTDEDLANIRKNAKILKQQYQAEIDSAVDNAETLANAYLMTNEDYAKLDEQSKNAASIMVNSLNADIVSKFGEDKENVGKYVDDIVQIISTNPDAKDAMIGLFTMDTTDMPVDDIEYWTNAYIDTIAKILQEDPTELKIRLGFDNDTTEPLKTKVQGFLKDEFDGKVGELTLEELDIASKLEIPKGTLLSWDELITKIEEFKNQNPDEITVLNFSDAFNAEEFEDTKEKLLELAKSGELSPYALLSIKEYNSLLEQTGLTAEQAYSEIMKIAQSDMFMEDWNNTLENARSQIAKIDELLTELDDNGQTSSFVDDIISDYPQLLEYLGDEQELREQLKALQEEQEDVARKAYTQLVSDSETYYNTFKTQETERLNTLNDTINTTISKNKSLVDTLGENYKIDLNNYKSITDAKAKLEMELIKNSASAWSKFYKVQVDATTGYASIIGSTTVSPSEYLDSSGDYGAAVNKFVEEQKKQKQSAQDVVDTYNSIIASLDSIANSTNITDTSSSSSSSKDSTSTFDWIETQISNMEDSLSKLDTQVSNTYSKWDARNQKLAESIAKTNEAITLQENAANAYMNEANSVGLSSHYKTLVQKGALNIEDISDKDLADKISEYQDLYEKSKECTDKANELRQTLNELSSSEKWDLLKSESDADIDILDKRIDAIQTSLDKLDLKGMFANSSYYNDMVDLTRNKISSLISQETELQNILKTMTTGTEAYDTMFAELMDIRNQIGELENDCIEFNNNIRDLDWEIFEFFEDSISRVREEFDFLKDLLSDKDMFDDNGNMTKYAEATIGLHFANIETYKKQAQDYYEEMQDLQKQLVNGAGQDVLEKYREYEDLYRDMISNIKDQKDAILDLVSQAYEEQISALERINDLTLERMDRERDLYNYQKNIAEKTKEKTSLERQIDVYSNSDSEESVAKVQQLKLELEKVNSDIEDMEYEQQRADTEAMLTNITEDFKLWQSQRLDNEAGLLENIRSEVESKSNEIQATLKEVAGQYGTTLSTSLTSIFGSEKPFDNVVTAINNLIAKISGIVGGDNTSNSNSGSGGGSVADTNKPVTQGKTTTATQNTQTDTQSKPESDGIFIPQKSVYPKNKLDKEKSVVDRLKYFDFASDFQSRATYYKKLGGTGTYTGSASQNKWLLKKMKEVGYASGTNYAKAGLHWTQEDGDELIIRKSDGALLTPLGMGDKVVNADGTNNLFTFANDPQGFLEKFGVLNYTPNLALPKMPIFQPRSSSNEVNLGGVHIAQVVANNPTEFTQQLKVAMANDRNVQKMVQELSFGQGLGNNTMNVKKYL